jgi:2,4-dienoyl-CoA reductase (NADPH2)
MHIVEPSERYPHIFRPIELSNITIANRIVMGSMHTGLEEDTNDLSRLAAFFKTRAQAGVGLIVTGGFAPNWSGMLSPFSAKLSNSREMRRHSLIADTVHQNDSKIVLQILHAGRYAYHPWSVAPSPIKSPITPFKPWRLTRRGVISTIKSFIRCAELAKQAGYDGVEIMASEGYLINQFVSLQTNHRQDEWGGDFQNRIRFAIEIVRGIRERLGQQFIIIFRLSMLDLVPKGSAWPEVVELAKQIEQAGASVINSGIGWHEARIPTIASMVPAGAFVSLTQQLRQEVKLPLIAANRINTPAKAQEILSSGQVDMVAMARPFLADPEWVDKAKLGHSHLINVCIACNQACLDQIFQKKSASCLVNPIAGRETELVVEQTSQVKTIAVVGGGPAGLAFAKTAAERGHQVTLFEAGQALGGQFNLAKQIPGKHEYQFTIDYYTAQLAKFEVEIHLNTKPDAMRLSHYDEVVFATGVKPRMPQIIGIDHPKVLNYVQALSGEVSLGRKVAIIGAGGIGVDVATWLTGHPQDFYQHWGIDLKVKQPGGLTSPQLQESERHITILQRKHTRVGAGLGKTTGWIHRLELKHRGVKMLSGVHYERIDDAGLHIRINDKVMLLDVDHIIICAGQEENHDLYDSLHQAGQSVHLLGGAYKALELDAKQAIEQATRLACML